MVDSTAARRLILQVMEVFAVNFSRSTRIVIAGLALGLGSVRGGDAVEPSGVAVLRVEASALRDFAQSDLAKRFLAGTADLPSVSPRVAYRDESTRQWYTREQADQLEPDKRAALKERTLDETFYYTTKYGSPLAYVRAIDVLAQHGVNDVAGKKLLDYGYGTVGHLRLLAALGATAVGVDVDSLLPVLYREPGDEGFVKGSDGRTGSVRLVHGRWPAEKAATESVGGDYDVIISKNTLKRGYIHPERPVDPKMLVDMGVSDEVFVKTVFGALKPGGVFFIYNLSPAPAPPDKPYIPWADGRCPFDEKLFKSAGFEIVAYDRDDSAAARSMGRLLGWDQGEGGMDLQNDLFAKYTILRKPS